MDNPSGWIFKSEEVHKVHKINGKWYTVLTNEEVIDESHVCKDFSKLSSMAKLLLERKENESKITFGFQLDLVFRNFTCIFRNDES